MEFRPEQHNNDIRRQIHNGETEPVFSEKVSMRPEVQDIATELDSSEEMYKKELENFALGDNEAKENAREYLETMQANFAERANSFDMNFDSVTPEESEVRSRVTVRLGELLDILTDDK